MPANLSLFQINLQGAILEAEAAGFTHFAAALRTVLLRELEASGIRPTAKRYGKFAVTESEQIERSAVESPRPIGTAEGHPRAEGRP